MICTGDHVRGSRRGYIYEGRAEVLARRSGCPQRVRIEDPATGDTLAVLYADECCALPRRRRTRNRLPDTPEGRAASAHWARMFRDNAERWWEQQGHVVPPAGTSEYTAMYNAWVDHMREG